MTDVKSVRLGLMPSLTIDTLEALRMDLLKSLQPETLRLELDAAQVERVDAAGLQLLLSACVEMRQRGGDCQVIAISDELSQAVASLGLRQDLGLPVALPIGNEA